MGIGDADMTDQEAAEWAASLPVTYRVSVPIKALEDWGTDWTNYQRVWVNGVLVYDAREK